MNIMKTSGVDKDIEWEIYMNESWIESIIEIIVLILDIALSYILQKTIFIPYANQSSNSRIRFTNKIWSRNNIDKWKSFVRDRKELRICS